MSGANGLSGVNCMIPMLLGAIDEEVVGRSVMVQSVHTF